MLDFNLYTDYCSVFGDDKDSGKILYSFVTWQEDRLLPQMNQFKDTLFDSIKECNETASNLTISEKRNVIAEFLFAQTIKRVNLWIIYVEPGNFYIFLRRV